MSQYSLGTVSAVNGSPVIHGVGTSWTAALAVGQLFAITSQLVWYTIKSVDSNTQLTLTGNYVGATITASPGAVYVVQRDFTPNNSYPIPSYGDTGSASLIAQTLLQLDTQLTALSVAAQALQGNITITGPLTITGSAFSYSGVAITGSTITGGTIDSAVIGATTMAAGSFTTLRGDTSLELGDLNAFQSWNAYSSGGWKYRATGYSYVWTNNDSNLLLSFAPSGAAGATITFNPALRISGSTGVVSFPAGATPPADWNNNRIINGGFDVWQNGTSFPVANNVTAYTADQWQFSNVNAANTLTLARAYAFDGEYCAKITGTMVSGSYFALIQPFEGQALNDLDGQPVTLSFDLAASTSAGTIRWVVKVLGNAGLDDGSFSATLVNLAGASIPTSVTTRASITFPATSTVGFRNGVKVAIEILQESGAGSVTAYIGAVQLEQGVVATPFAVKPIWAEMAACQRYFQCSWPNLSNPNNPLGPWLQAPLVANNGLFPSGSIDFDTQLRAAPTMLIYDVTGAVGKATVGGANGQAIGFGSPTASGVNALLNSTGATINAGTNIQFNWSANARL